MKKVLFILNHLVLLILLTGISVSSVSSVASLTGSSEEITNNYDTQDPVLLEENDVNLSNANVENTSQSEEQEEEVDKKTDILLANAAVEGNSEEDSILDEKTLEDGVSDDSESQNVEEQVTVPLELTELNDLIEKVESKRAIDYDTATWKVFAAALDDARGIRNRATQSPETVTQEEIRNTTSQLMSAHEGLVSLKGESKPLEFDLTHLNKAIEVVIKEKSESYTTTSWQFLMTILDDAREIKEQAIGMPETITQTDIDNITKKLVVAHIDLESIKNNGSVESVLKQLNDLIKKVEKEKAINYVTAHWKVFAEVLDEAREIQGKSEVNPEQVTQEQIMEVIEKLTKAQAELVSVEESKEKEKETELDLTKLDYLIKVATEENKSAYTTESWDKFIEVLNKAMALQKEANETPEMFSQEKINDMVASLETVQNNLVLVKTQEITSSDKGNQHKGEPETSVPEKRDDSTKNVTSNNLEASHDSNTSYSKPSGVNQSERLPQTSEKEGNLISIGLLIIFVSVIYGYYHYKNKKAKSVC